MLKVTVNSINVGDYITNEDVIRMMMKNTIMGVWYIKVANGLLEYTGGYTPLVSTYKEVTYIATSGKRIVLQRNIDIWEVSAIH